MGIMKSFYNVIISIAVKTGFNKKTNIVSKKEVNNNNKNSDIEYVFSGESEFKNVKYDLFNFYDDKESINLDGEFNQQIHQFIKILKRRKKFFNFIKKNKINKCVRINFVLPSGENFIPGFSFSSKKITQKKYIIYGANNYEISIPELNFDEVLINISDVNIRESGLFPENFLSFIDSFLTKEIKI
jgi:hypothetical protein